MLKKEDYEPGFWTEGEKSDCGGNKTAFYRGTGRCGSSAGKNREIPDEMKVVPAQNESYQNFIIRYSRNVDGAVNYESDRSFQIINELFESSIYRLLRCRNLCSTAILTLPFPSVIHIWIRAA